jgi:hypothetical protein
MSNCGNSRAKSSGRGGENGCDSPEISVGAPCKKSAAHRGHKPPADKAPWHFGQLAASLIAC